MSQSGAAPTLPLHFCIYATDGKKDAGLGKLQRGPAAVGLWCERTVLKSIKKRPMLCISHVEMDRQSHLTAKGRNVHFVDQVQNLCVNLIQGVHGNITLERSKPRPSEYLPDSAPYSKVSD